MKILFLSWENFCTEDMKNAFISEGHEVCMLPTSQEELLSPRITAKVSDSMKKYGCDIIFGFNYFPYVAQAAHDDGFEYYAWVYDNPCVQLYSCTAIWPTNHIFVFDSDTCLTFRGSGVDTVGFLPMAADPDRLAGLYAGAGGFVNDIAFVGALYNEEHNFYSRMIAKGISPRTEGYLRGIMEAQKQVYGLDLTERMLNDEIIEDMHRALPLEPGPDSVITKQTLFAGYVIDRKITAEERKKMLEVLGADLGSEYRISFYTRDASVRIPGCTNRGTVSFFDEAPVVYNRSRINLNISLRSIINGIPLRCFDIMGAGGFLMTSYAGDMQEFFVPGEDYAAFDLVSSLRDLCRYYLEHEDERAAIAASGLARIRESHTFVHRVREMFS